MIVHEHTSEVAPMKRRVCKSWCLTKLVTLIALVVLQACSEMVVCYAQEKRQAKQYQSSVQPAPESTGLNVVVSPREDYRIGPSDVIEIQVEDAPELSRTFRVSADGVIIMPFLGHLTAKDKTAQELADAITGGLRGQYLNEPMVRVTVNQINSCTFFIQGAVRRPGLYQIEGQTTLLKLITVAGGLNENHGSTAFIIRQLNADTRGKQSIGDSEGERHLKQVESEPDGAESSNATPKYDLMKVNINSLLKGSFDQNAVVEPTDIVYIPPADIFFVAGEVNAPGSFPLREGTTLRQAITLAQGMTFRAAAGRGTIFREDPKTSNRQEIKVDINAVMNGKSPDIAVQPDDIIIVPNSRAKSVTDTILKAFGVNAWRFPRAY